jgi:CBS domain containing-hemolysin-like protein
LIGKPVAAGAYLSREELQNVIEERDETITTEPAKKESSTVIANIFNLKNQTAKDLMQPLTHVALVPSFCTVAEMRELVSDKHVPFLPIYHRNPQNIVGIAIPRDLLRASSNKRIKEYARPPWFIAENSSILHILKQFRRNNQSLAVVLNEKGLAIGILTLDEIIDEIFGCTDEWMALEEMMPRVYHVAIDRTFPGDMTLSEFNTQFSVNLSYRGAETIGELMTLALGHTPSKGESVRIDQFELTVEEASLLGAKMILVRTVF